ncbi:MAG: GNAT family N-acetyltransferase [Chroococcidiopsidaceae cyanobacterium CP_BM_ER_R8_30]|nr:GNAT family N-acetyltransferase [Chroococcidiopsidaceae cyanobacterium CP_BM_ER_R8_30]
MDEESLELDVVQLSKKHNRTIFSCGNAELDRYIREQARQDSNKYCARPFVLIDKNDDTRIIGYHTLSSAIVVLTDLPSELTKKFPRYPIIPATLLGRLAVEQQFQGRKLGTILFMHALEQALKSSITLASAVVIVDAKDSGAVGFYKRFGFKPIMDQPLRLYKPMIDITKQFSL